MRIILAICLVLLTITSFSQCVKCKSIEEAQKNPTIVKSIQINPFLGGMLNEVPVSIGVFVNLEELYLSDLKLKKIPKEIGKLKKLKRLSFAGNNLKELPEEIFQLQNLKEIILLDNEFTEAYKLKLKRDVKSKLPRTQLLID